MKITLIFKQMPGSITWLFYIWLSLYYLLSNYSNFSTFATWSWCQPYGPFTFTTRKYCWYLFLLEAGSTPGVIVRSEGLSQWKIPVRPSGIEPATLRLITQCLNQLRHRISHLQAKLIKKYVKEGNIKTREAIYILRNTEACLCNHRCSGKAISITYSECVFVALISSMKGARAILSSVACLDVPYFSTYATIFGAQNMFDFLYNFCLKHL